MIEYFEQLTQEEQESLTEIIQTLYRQTFILERKFDRRGGRMVYTKEHRTCTRHFEFLKAYFAVAGISLKESVHMGLIYIQGEGLWGEKLPKLATIYLLLLKLIYDEQMQIASTSSHIVTTMGAVNGKAGEFRVLTGLPSVTEMRRAIALLKRYQIVEPLDVLEELNENTRMVIYPSIQAVLMGDDIRELLGTFGGVREENQQTLYGSGEEQQMPYSNTGKEPQVQDIAGQDLSMQDEDEEELNGDETAV